MRPLSVSLSRAIFVAAALGVATTGCVRRADPGGLENDPAKLLDDGVTWERMPVPGSVPNVEVAAPEPQFQSFPEPMGSPTARPPVGEVLVQVNGEAITTEDFAKGYLAFLDSTERETDSPETRGVYLNVLVGDLLLEQEARRQGLEDDPAFHRRLAQVKQEAIEEALLERVLAGRVAVTDAEVESHHEQHKGEYTKPKSIQVRNITTYTREAALRARESILGGEDFSSVAQSTSIHPSRSEGGSLPAFSPGTYHPDFEKQAFALKIGELSPVFETNLGYHVIEKTGETPGRVTPLSQVREEIRAALSKTKRREALEELNLILRETAKIRVLRNP
jgi:peptidyl-prolyl cis-trans isomerase C